ncbi:zinc finger, CCHC-type, retrotransposon gag domain protein [Tanacetum coccineum]
MPQLTTMEMPPRRNRRNNRANPACAAAVEQAVTALLHTLTTRITDEIRQNENNGNNGNRRNGRCRASTPVEAENWIAHIEKSFEFLVVIDQIKSSFETYKLKGDAHSWWGAYKKAKGGDVFMATLAWNDFRDIFFLQYFPYSEKEKCEREYKSIHQLLGETILSSLKNSLDLAAQVATIHETLKSCAILSGQKGNNKRNR